MNNEKTMKVIFAGFSYDNTEKLIVKMAKKLKKKASYGIYLPQKNYREDRMICHVCFADNPDIAAEEGYFISGSADMICAAADRDAVRNISWLKTEGTVIILNNEGGKRTMEKNSTEMREFLQKQEEYGFVRTIIH